MATSK